MIEMQPLTQRLRETLAERYYRGEITSSALTEQLNLERQEAADEIERLEARREGNPTMTKYAWSPTLKARNPPLWLGVKNTLASPTQTMQRYRTGSPLLNAKVCFTSGAKRILADPFQTMQKCDGGASSSTPTRRKGTLGPPRSARPLPLENLDERALDGRSAYRAPP